MDTFGDMPAYVLGRRTDVLAANQMARVLLTNFSAMPARERNATRWLLLDERARAVYRTWEDVASDIVGCLRLDAVRRPDDPRTSELVGELSAKSPEFRKWWASQRVVTGCGEKHLHHPVVGDLEFEVEALRSHDDEDQTLFVYLPKVPLSIRRGARGSFQLAGLPRYAWFGPVGCDQPPSDAEGRSTSVSRSRP